MDTKTHPSTSFLMVCSERWDECGAHTVHPLEIAKALIKRGHDVTLFLPYVKKPAQVIDIPFVMIPAPRWFKGSSFIFFELLLTFYLIPPIRAAKKQHKQVVLYSRHREIGLASLLVRYIFSVPFIDEYNDITWETLFYFAQNNISSRFERFLKTNALLKFLIQTLEKIIFRGANAIIAVTPELKNYIVRLTRLPADTITVIPNGCNIDDITVLNKKNCRALLGLEEQALYLGHIGSLNHWQGIDDVLDAFALLIAEVPRVKLLLVGDGPYRSALEEKVATLALQKHVLFTGHVPHQKIALYIGAVDICMFLKKLTSYGLSSLKLYEYLAAGPIIGRDIPSISFIKENDIGALLPLDASAEQIKTTIAAFLKRPDLDAVSARARKLAETTYNWDIAARKIEAICQKL